MEPSEDPSTPKLVGVRWATIDGAKSDEREKTKHVGVVVVDT